MSILLALPILIVVAMLVAAVMAMQLMKYSTKGHTYMHDIAGLAGMLSAIALCAAGIFYGYVVFLMLGSGYRADIINREYGTNYTAAEVFFASSVIDTVRELDRKRIELNGNLMHNKNGESL